MARAIRLDFLSSFGSTPTHDTFSAFRDQITTATLDRESSAFGMMKATSPSMRLDGISKSRIV